MTTYQATKILPYPESRASSWTVGYFEGDSFLVVATYNNSKAEAHTDILSSLVGMIERAYVGKDIKVFERQDVEGEIALDDGSAVFPL